MLCDLAVSHNRPQIESDGLIHKKSSIFLRIIRSYPANSDALIFFTAKGIYISCPNTRCENCCGADTVAFVLGNLYLFQLGDEKFISYSGLIQNE